MVAVKVLGPPLDAISREARPYPAYLLPEGGTGLCLFAAAFLGHNDAIHMARQEMFVTCIDEDAERLTEMAEIYYEGGHAFAGIIGDAWSYAEQWQRGDAQFDVVSCDTWTGDLERRSLDSLDLWCSLARNAVTVTHSNGSAYTVPDGWTDMLFPRSSDVNWLVLTR